MRHRQLLAAALLLAACAAAHAEHFDFTVSLDGTYSLGGTDGCTPPFDQPACPRPGHLDAILSFDTPSAADGDYSIGSGPGEVGNFFVSVGAFSTDLLMGDIGLLGGAPTGNIQALDGSESFFFNAAGNYASFNYDYGYHEANGSFTGTLASVSSVPEPAGLAMMLSALLAMAGATALRRRAGRARD
jgi:hypothetical protein